MRTTAAASPRYMAATFHIAADAKTEAKQFVVVNETSCCSRTTSPIAVTKRARRDRRDRCPQRRTIFSKAPSQEKIYRELWKRAEKLGADAVINASYGGDARVTAMSWGASEGHGHGGQSSLLQ